MPDTASATIDLAAALAYPRRLDELAQREELLVTIMRAWPGDLDQDRRKNKTYQLITEAVIAVEQSKDPTRLCQCTAASLFDSLTTIAGLDLTLAKAMGEVYLVPFARACTAMVGYRGFIKLTVNTGVITHMESVLVYDGEPFSWTRDENGPHWQHEPNLALQGNADKVVGCYTIGYKPQPPHLFEAMNIAELEHVRRVSKMAKSGPYADWRTEMYRKAPIRRMQKYIPKLTDSQPFRLLQRAMEHDNTFYDLGRVKQLQDQAEGYDQRRLEDKRAEWSRRLDKPEAPSDPTAEAEKRKAAEKAMTEALQVLSDRDCDGYKITTTLARDGYTEGANLSGIADPQKLAAWITEHAKDLRAKLRLDAEDKPVGIELTKTDGGEPGGKE